MTGQLSAWMAIVVFCCTTVVIDVASGASAEDYKRLHWSLLANYSTSVRPVLDQDETVFIATALYLAGINDVDTVAQRLVTTAFLDLAWFDEFLQWDELSTGIEIMYFKQHQRHDEMNKYPLSLRDACTNEIWTPDLVLKNSVQTVKELGGDFYYLSVTSDGLVRWLPFQVFESKCAIDITFFPFDDQTCYITVHSWSFNKYEVNVTHFLNDDFPVNFYDFVENSVWSIVSTGSSASPESEVDSEVTFILHLRRKPLYYVMNLIFPVVLLGFLNLLVFVIPADAGEKMSFAMTVFLSFAVFLSIISMQLPTNSDKTSLLGVYLVFQMILGVGTITISSLQLRLHHRNSEVGRFYRGIVKFERYFRCTKCKKFPRIKPVGEDNLDVVDWRAVSSAIDFVSLFTMLVLEIVAISVLMVKLIHSTRG